MPDPTDASVVVGALAVIREVEAFALALLGHAQADDRIDDLHYWTTYVKFGIGRATYDAAQEIRSGDITRQEGVALVKRFDGEWPARFEDELMAYLSLPAKDFPIASREFAEPIMTRASFLKHADAFRSPHLWRQANGSWQLRHAVWHAEDDQGVGLAAQG